MERTNAEWMKTAAQYEARRQSLGIRPEEAEVVKTRGRDEFYSAFWGRYGLPPGGGVVPQPDEVPDNAGDEAGRRFDLTRMSARDVIALASDLMNAGLGDARDMALMSFDFSRLSYAKDEAFISSPLAHIGNTLGLPGRRGRTYDWIREYEMQLKHLNEQNGDAGAIRSTRNVLQQLRLLQTEQNMYAAMGLENGNGRDGRRESGSFFSQTLVNPALLLELN